MTSTKAAMTAVIFEGKEKMRVAAVPRPVCGPGDVLLEVAACGICGGDARSYFAGDQHTAMRRIPGHEVGGTVSEAARGVTAWAPGDRLALAERRRDACCGKVSVCNNLRQYGIPFTLTTLHTVHPSAPSFREDVRRFAATCKVANGMRNLRLGAIGARPNAFNTTRYSEKLLQSAGISVSTLDLSELFGAAGRLEDSNANVAGKLEEIRGYARTNGVPAAALLKMAKLAVAMEEWMGRYDIQATALQCWNSIQQNFGVNACTIMSMMSQKLMPSACEVDVTGVAAMYALQLASGTPSALVDWNNNYGDHPDKCVFFHGGNWAKAFLPDIAVGTAEILGTTLGLENTYGAVAGRTPAGPVTFARVSTDDRHGCLRTYVGEGRFTDDPLSTFGSRAVVEVHGLQKLMRYICKDGFEHHAAMNASSTAAMLAEAFETYLGWEVYHHRAE
ncbi:MAG: alcohol dehydrogenase catalytic domain-containing protein [Bryobacteraceae bacterium]